MSNQARIFAEGYRDKPLKTFKISGVDYLVAGQHEAIWNDPPSNSVLEVSYVVPTGHKFVVVVLMADSLQILKIYEVDIYGIDEKTPPRDFELDDNMVAAIARLKTATNQAAA